MSEALLQRLKREREGLFAESTVSLSFNTIAALRRAVADLWAIMTTPAWEAAALADAPAIARKDVAAAGFILGFDFHLTPAGPKLIEVNTNPGGAFLNALAAPPAVAERLISVFAREWRRFNAGKPLSRVGIVDDGPAEQFLHPEFELVAAWLREKGVDAVIGDARALVRASSGGFLVDGAPVDFVYNRCTDFYFDDPVHAVLRGAVLDASALISPGPRAHALFADKAGLVRLSDAAWMSAHVTPAAAARAAEIVPFTRLVTRDRADELWAQRKHLFFKPTRGYASKAAYRGDKLTKGTFADILGSPYVAQALVTPSEQHGFKVDLRAYAYEGEVISFAARIYRGQTTNFRTPGGGFAAVEELRAGSERGVQEAGFVGAEARELAERGGVGSVGVTAVGER